MESLKPSNIYGRRFKIGALTLLLTVFVFTWCIMALDHVYGILVLTADLFFIWMLCCAEGGVHFRRAIISTKFYIIILLAMYLFVRHSIAYDLKSGLVAAFKEISYFVAPTLFCYIKETYSPTSKKRIIHTICLIWVLIAFVQLYLYLSSDFDYARAAISVQKDLFSIANHAYDFCYSACFIGIACFEKLLDKHVRCKIASLFAVATLVVIFTKSTIAILGYGVSLVVCFLSKAMGDSHVRDAAIGSRRGSSISNNISVSKTWIAVLITAGIGYICKAQIGYLFLGVSNIFTGTLKHKLIDVATFFIYGKASASMSVRMELYSFSFENACKHPVLGNLDAYAHGNNVVGMHSELFDTLSLYGFLFTIVQYGWIFYILLKNKTFRKHNTNAALLFFVFINLLNPFNYFTGYFALLFIVPALLNNWDDPRGVEIKNDDSYYFKRPAG